LSNVVNVFSVIVVNIVFPGTWYVVISMCQQKCNHWHCGIQSSMFVSYVLFDHVWICYLYECLWGSNSSEDSIHSM